MKSKSMILYTTIKPNPDLGHITIIGCHRETGEPFEAHIRAEVVDADAEEAIVMAEPKEGESLLNTFEL